LAKRLDKALSNLEWQTAFPEAYVENLCCFHFDHNPIILRYGRRPSLVGGRPFKFEVVWTTHPNYQEVICNAWERCSYNVF